MTTSAGTAQSWGERPGVVFGAACLVAVVLAAAVCVSYFDFHHRDVGWSLWVADKLLDGARLYTDIVDENPPWLYWLSTLPVALSRVLGAEPNTVYNGFVVLLSVFSSAFVYTLLRRGWPEVDAPLRATLSVGVAVSLLLLPGSEFGQRENILAATVIPYLFAAASWLRGRPLGPALALALALFASIGLLFKPHFYLLCVCVELLLLVDGRGLGSLRRVEPWTIAGVAVAYAISVPLLLPQYFDIVRVALEYYDGYGHGWSLRVLMAPGVGWALAAAGLCGLFKSTAMTRELRRVLLAGIVGLVVAGFLQFKGWYYHYDGARLIAAVLIGFVLMGPLVRPAGLQPVVRARPALVPIVALAVLLAFAAFRLGVVLESRFGDEATRPTVFGELTQVVKENAGSGSILVLSTSAFPAFPLVNASGADWSNRYWALWLLPGLYSAEEKSARPFVYRERDEMDELEREFIDTFVDDILSGRPALLIVDRRSSRQGFPNSSIDFLTYLLRDLRFAEEFQKYSFLTDVAAYRVYKRDSQAEPGARPL